MKIFSPLYERAMAWSRHRRAPWFLGVLSFAESSFFPIPPDVMLAPMSLANPRRAWWFALLTTLTSVAGGLFGYLIGYFAFDLIEGWLRGSSYWGAYEQAVAWFEALRRSTTRLTSWSQSLCVTSTASGVATTTRSCTPTVAISGPSLRT